jgi:hypothetical protein
MIQLPLSEAQQIAVLNAARPLGPGQTDAFVADLVSLYAGKPSIGDGEVYRSLRQLQREYFRPPDTGESHGATEFQLPDKEQPR